MQAGSVLSAIGFVGVGGMGSGMARRLLAAGHSVVVCDKDPAAVLSLEQSGALAKTTPCEVANATQVVFSMLPDGPAVRDVALGRNGLNQVGATGGHVWIDCSSIDRATLVDVAAELAKTGWSILDVAVGGVEERAANGELVLWSSGDQAIFDSVKPLLDCMGSTILHVGELGTAKLVKTGLAMLAAIHHLGLVEIFNWMRKVGMPDHLFPPIMQSWHHRSPTTDRLSKKLLERAVKKRASWMPKDVRFGLGMAEQLHVPMPLSQVTNQIFTIAEANQLDGYDAPSMALFVYELLGGVRGGPPL